MESWVKAYMLPRSLELSIPSSNLVTLSLISSAHHMTKIENDFSTTPYRYVIPTLRSTKHDQ